MYQEQLLEWIGLVLIKSERIKIDDKVDPYICRYQFPEAFEETADTKAENLTHLRWHGLIPPRLIRELLNVLESELKKGWFAMGSKSLEGRTCFVVAADQTVISWDMT
jgi:ribonuclease P/MRP protein subunit RPP40